MNANLGFDEQEWPPGTVRIEDLLKGGEIILQPRPSIDPNDPLNWPAWRKYLNFGLACFYVVIVAAAIGVVTATWGSMNRQLGFSFDTLNVSYATGCAGLAIGGLMFIPLALKFGRRPIYLVSTIAQCLFSVWAAKTVTVGDLIGWNTLNCLFGSLAEIIVQITVADMFFVHQRGRMNSIFFWSFICGSGLAPVAAGYVNRNLGWKWVWWIMAIIFGVSWPIYIFFFEETKYDHPYEAVDPLEPQAQEDLEKKPTHEDIKDKDITAGPQYTPVEIDPTIPQRTYVQRLALWRASPGPFGLFLRHSYQPLLVCATIPAVAYMSLVYSIINASTTVAITVLSEYMYSPPYNFDSSQVGLMSIPMWLGTTLGLLVCGPVSDWSILYLAKRNNGVYEPEMRLWVMAAFVPFVPTGLCMFGIGLAKGLPWPVIAVGYGLLTFGTSPISSIALTYLTDAYTDIVADSIVAITVTRNIVATIFVFAIAPWESGMGLQNVFIMLAVLSTAILLSVFGFIFYGKTMRVKTIARYRHFGQRQINPRGVVAQ